MDELLQAIHDVATGKTVCKPHRIQANSTAIKRAIDSVATQVKGMFPNLPNARWVAMRLLDGDVRIVDAIRKGELGDLTAQVADQALVLEVLS